MAIHTARYQDQEADGSVEEDLKADRIWEVLYWMAYQLGGICGT